jgi:carnitine-CoA ligase
MSATPLGIAAHWAATALARPRETFLVWEDDDGTGREWTYAEFDALVRRCGAALRRTCGGRPVLVALPNGPGFLGVWLAALLAGVTVVPADPRATAREVRGHAEQVGAGLLVATESRRDELSGVELPAPTWWLDPAASDAAAGLGAHLLDDVLIGTGDELPGADQAAAIMFTSGTTSQAKGVVVSQATYGFTARVMAEAAGLTPADRCLVALPLFHANAQYYSVAPAIVVGATVCLVPRFSASNYLPQAARLRATHASLFAAPLRMILTRQVEPSYGLRLRHVWYAQNLTDEQYRRCVRLLGGVRPRQLYGMTETGPAVLTSDATDPHPQRLGRPTAGCRVELQDDDGRPVPVGEVGEIAVGGQPGRELFAGYHEMPEATARAFRRGWFRTGDLALVHPDGQWRFVGRRGDNLKVAGENVSVVEVEELLRSHPAVLDVAVVGVPDAIRDEVPWAFVVPRNGGEPDVLAEFAAQRLAPPKRPRGFTFVAELPRTAVGKVLRRELRQAWDQDAGRTTADAAAARQGR